jgi:hypothetical protein
VAFFAVVGAQAGGGGSSSGPADALTLGQAAATAYLELLFANGATQLLGLLDNGYSSRNDSRRAEASTGGECEQRKRGREGGGGGNAAAAVQLTPLPGLAAARLAAAPAVCSHWWCGVQQLVADAHAAAAAARAPADGAAGPAGWGRGAHRCTRAVARELLGRCSAAAGEDGGLRAALGASWAQLEAADCDLTAGM